jgi:shikimate kinase
VRRSAEHIVLIGMMGSGKTTIGHALAERLGFGFVDSDEVIQSRTGRTVREIFATEGEATFRRLESAALLDALDWREPLVVAAAGGVVLAEPNRVALRERAGRIIWLTAPVEVLAARAETGSHRPLLDDDVGASMARLYAAREPLYRELAHQIVASDDRPVADIVSEIVGSLPS